MEITILEKLLKVSKEAFNAQKSATKWNNKCMGLPPRM
jgi:hypothetical protein